MRLVLLPLPMGPNYCPIHGQWASEVIINSRTVYQCWAIPGGHQYAWEDDGEVMT